MRGEKEILGLDVAVDDIVHMQVLEPQNQMAHVRPDRPLSQRDRLAVGALRLRRAALHKFENEEDLVLRCVEDHVVEEHTVRVHDLLHRRDLGLDRVECRSHLSSLLPFKRRLFEDLECILLAAI